MIQSISGVEKSLSASSCVLIGIPSRVPCGLEVYSSSLELTSKSADLFFASSEKLPACSWQGLEGQVAEHEKFRASYRMKLQEVLTSFGFSFANCLAFLFFAFLLHTNIYSSSERNVGVKIPSEQLGQAIGSIVLSVFTVFVRSPSALSKSSKMPSNLVYCASGMLSSLIPMVRGLVEGLAIRQGD